jgi:tetratricopeptide (TPR) repeat protein
MKFGFRTPSIKKRIAARTSVKRYVRHNLGVKMPKGLGVLSNPKKALYNKVYNKTTWGVEDLISTSKNSRAYSSNIPFQKTSPKDDASGNSSLFFLIFIGLIALFFNTLVGIAILGISPLVALYQINSPSEKERKLINNVQVQFEENNYETIISLIGNDLDTVFKSHELTYYLGASYHNLENYSKAIEPLKKLLFSKQPNDSLSLILGNCYYKVQMYVDAITTLQEISENDQQLFHKAILLISKSFFEQKEYTNAIGILQKASLRKRNLDSDLMEIHYTLGVSNSMVGDKKTALKHFKKVSRVDESYKDVADQITQLSSSK